MPSKNSEEQLTSDDSGVDDRSESDDDYHSDGSYSESEGEDGRYSEGEDRSYSDDDDNGDYDYEKGFHDEQSENPSYVTSQRFADEDGETTKNDYWWEGREKMIALILLCWCCLCLIIIAVVLGVVLGGKNRNEDDISTEILPAPTERPTFAPQPLPPSSFTQSPTDSMVPTVAITLSPTIEPTKYPTFSPTLSFYPTGSIPKNLSIIADQDTFTQYNVSKEFQGEEYGLRDTFLVQKVPLKDENLADSVAILSFPLTDVPVFSRVAAKENSVVLRLKHVISTDERLSANYTVVRIPETKTRMEYWHGFYFEPPEDDEVGVKVGPEFEVSPTDDVVDIDVSSLFFNYTLVDNKKPKKVFFMIENRGPDQVEGGDRFYTRESDTPPMLLFDFEDEEDTDAEINGEAPDDEGGEGN